ncbi:MAG TPA: MG2 domain-containing protein, partial [Vicinamibacterales bacterium]|nr:MG2 domain-containing protein [Vicinamibacterales bacterium]
MRTLLIMIGVLAPAAARAQEPAPLTVVSAQPTGEIANLAQAAEIRVRFSEVMVPIGRIPDDVRAPFFTVRPAIAGTFRWAGPTILVFTPDPKAPLPHATRYDVTISADAAAVSGRRLARPYAFSFTTPTVRLLETSWYRQGGRFDRPVTLALRFNQPVRAADVAAHTTARHAPHPFNRPLPSTVERTQLDPAESARFDAKVAVAAAVAASQAPIGLRVAADWDQQRFPPSSDLVVLETTSVPLPDAWIRVAVDNRMPAVEGRALPPVEQSHVVQVEPTLFVDGFNCRTQCDADSYNVASMRGDVPLAVLRGAATVRDITTAAQPAPVAKLPTPHETWRTRQETIRVFSFEDLGFDRQTPARTWALTIDASVTAVDGQTLGYKWTGVVENWHDRAFASFGDGHGVWETGGGPLPFSARNFTSTRQWVQPLSLPELMPTILALDADHFRAAPSGAGTQRSLAVNADRIQSYGLNLAPALTPQGTGVVWAAVLPGQTIPRTRRLSEDKPVASVVQVTNLGITVKDSPQGTLVFVTRLDNGSPVAGADVSIVRLDNSVAWSGRTSDDGVAMAPAMALRDKRRTWKFAFIVTAAKDGDLAYVGSDWNEGIQPFEFGTPYSLFESQSVLRGTVFSDRGVYKLGEEVHVKAILRRDTPSGIQLVAAGTPLSVQVRDSRDKVVDSRTVTLSAWSTAEWLMRVPAEGSLGDYQISVSLDKAAFEPPTPGAADAAVTAGGDDEGDANWLRVVHGNFLVAAYRRPDFRVDANLAGDALAGGKLKGVVNARYLFGAAMANRPVSWTYSRSPVMGAPQAVLSKYPGDRFQFVGCCDEGVRFESSQLASKTGSTNAGGLLSLDLDTEASDGVPYQYSFEGDVEDVSRQHIAGSASFIVHPAPWYIGLRRPALFVEQKDGINTSVVAVGLDGNLVAGVNVELTLVEVQYHSARRAEGNGFYTWDVERREVEAGRFHVVTGSEPVPLAIPLKTGGSFVLRAVAQEGAYKSITRLAFYAL